MKPPSDLFSRLPSVSDLLDKPQLKALMKRVSELEVASGARQFVDRLRREVSRRSIDMPIPSIGELADRAAKFILGKSTSDLPRVINATGQLWPAETSGPPLSEEALAAMTIAAQHYHGNSSSELCESIADFVGAEAAIVATSPNAALLLAMRALAEGGSMVVARGELGTLDHDVRLTDLAELAGARLVEVGATNSVTLADYEQALNDNPSAIVLRMESTPYAVAGQSTRPAMAELASLGKSRDVVCLQHLDRGPLVPVSELPDLASAAASTSISAATSLVIARGDGLLGGPACGIVVGRRAVVEKLSQQSLASILQVDSLTSAALTATIGVHQNAESPMMSIPVLSLLATPIENLRLRAERMAAQIAGKPGIAEASAVALAAGSTSLGVRHLDSFGVSIVPESGKLPALQKQLAEGRPQLVGCWETSRLVLDLRTVFPSDDIELVGTFDPDGSPAESEDVAAEATT